MSQMPQINCPHCNQAMPLLAELSGQQAICPGCQQRFTVPAVPPPVAVPLANNPQNHLKPVPAQYANMRREHHSKTTTWVIVLVIGFIVFNVLCGILGGVLQFVSL